MNRNATRTRQNTQRTPALVTAIYNLVATLFPFVDSIYANGNIPWLVRENAAKRIVRIAHKLLALTIRMDPRRLGQAAFAALRARTNPQPQNPTPEPRRPTDATRPIRRHGPMARRTILPARQIALRIAAYLRELEAIAQEIGHPLPERIKTLSNRVHTIAGCRALPATSYWFETTPATPGPPSPPPPPSRTLEL